MLTPLVTAWLVMQVGVDMLVTGTLAVVLVRSRTGFRKTDTVVNRLIRGAVQTGLFAGIFSLGDLITFTRWPDTNFYGMFAIPIGRIYTNVSSVGTLLAHCPWSLTFMRADAPRYLSLKDRAPPAATRRDRRRLYST